MTSLTSLSFLGRGSWFANCGIPVMLPILGRGVLYLWVGIWFFCPFLAVQLSYFLIFLNFLVDKICLFKKKKKRLMIFNIWPLFLEGLNIWWSGIMFNQKKKKKVSPIILKKKKLSLTIIRIRSRELFFLFFILYFFYYNLKYSNT